MRSVINEQVVPIVLTLVAACVLVGLLLAEIALLNRFAGTGISLHIRWYDVLIGMTIYLKTSIDFALFIARIMEKNQGWRSRVAIEIGTAAGNGAGTLAILLVWSLFHEVSWLLGLMIVIASLVLLRLAEEGAEHATEAVKGYRPALRRPVQALMRALEAVNALFAPVLRYIVPSTSTDVRGGLRFWPLIAFSFTVPFILGLDDFAGYVPLFSIVNVVGFATGVFVGHMVLNILLYISPKVTIRIVTQPVVSLVGSAAFVVLAAWGFVEAVRLLFGLH